MEIDVPISIEIAKVPPLTHRRSKRVEHGERVLATNAGFDRRPDITVDRVLAADRHRQPRGELPMRQPPLPR
ncbi:hypothetical protein [Saccharopolyspora phatthalungensis]|uniref:Uncharacterized protein n=1 Tax=Saccharopolyspora phatthalungensis TaxID=664693 RepID=A0A840QAN6_9PSEU|nr:hypothetical protein [Saccharopolyspora phatthalungensis]MBB5159602.1 hypothetical protein [Saccharopolyspora phatthalungensis]